MSYLKKILALAIIAVSIVATSFWSELWRIREFGGASYEEKKTELAFAKLPVDGFAARLDELLPSGEPIALVGALKANDFLKQRLTEGLYPRRIDSSAKQVMGADPNSGVLLTGPVKALLEPKTEPPVFFSWLAFFALSFSAAGLGLAVLRLARVSLTTTEMALGAAIFSGALVIGLVTSLATWAQLPVPAMALFLVGAACGAALLPRKKPDLRALGRWIRKPENALFTVLALLFFFKVFEMPISMWDGRSIWLFRAKEIFRHSMFARIDMLHPDYDWSHPEYPLLIPSWLAYFNAFGGNVFSERMASMGLPLLATALFLLVRPLAGPVVTAALFFGTQQLFCGAYADGFVLLFLVLGFLAESEFLCMAAALGASMAKFEGFVFAVIVAALARKRPRFFLVFVPAVAHIVWGRRLGLRGDFHDIQWSAVLGTLFERAETILAAVPELLGRSSLLLSGLAALFIGAPLLLTAYRGNRSQKTAKRALISGLCFLAVIFALFLITPRDLPWHLRTAMDRLLLHPAAFFLLTIL